MQKKSILFLFLVIFLSLPGLSQNPVIVIPTSHNSEILSIQIDSQNRYFYTADEWQIIMWDVKTMKQLYTFKIANKVATKAQGNKGHNFKNLKISPDGNIIAFNTDKDILKIFSTVTGKQLQSINGVSSRFTFSKDSKTIYDLVVAAGSIDYTMADGRMVRSINVSTGKVEDYWNLKQLKSNDVYESFFFPLLDSRILNFTENGYEILDLDDKKTVDTKVISTEARNIFTDPAKPYSNNYFQVFPESGQFVFQQHRKTGLGWTSWDIYANKEFAFFPAYAVINIQQSFNNKDLIYITRGNRNRTQELVLYSQGYKIEKKKLVTNSDEIRIAALSKKKNTIIYADYGNNLYITNLDKTEKTTVAKVLPNINVSHLYRDGNQLSFIGQSIISDDANHVNFDNFGSEYVVDLSRASITKFDTMPTLAQNAMSPLKLSKDRFLLDYISVKTDKRKFAIYDRVSKKSSPFVLKDFSISDIEVYKVFAGLPKFFTFLNPDLVWYSTIDGTAKTFTYNLIKYNLATKQSQKIFTAYSLEPAKWESLRSGSSTARPASSEQLILDRTSELMAAAENDYKGSVRIIDVNTGKILARHPFLFDSLKLSKNVNVQNFLQAGNDYLPFIIKQISRISKDVVRVLGSEYLYDFNLSDGTVKEKKIIDRSLFDGKNRVNIFGDHSLTNVIAAYQDGDKTIAKTVFGANNINLDNLSSPINKIEFTQNDSIIYTINADNSMNAYNAITGKFYGTLYTFENSSDWVFVDLEGRFDGTDEGMKKLYFLRGRDVINLDKVYEIYYTPGLFTRLVAGERFAPIPEIRFKPKPKAKIFYAEKQRNLEVDDDIASYVSTTGLAEITVHATAPEDKVDEIRLFHNGKVLNLATRGMFVADDDGTETKKYTVNLLPGKNSFRAIALNSQRTESDADEILVSYAANGNAPAPKPVNNATDASTLSMVDKNATLYLMVVGINAYTNKINPLTYALPDATAFKEEIEKDAKSILANVKTYFVSDAKADKAGIINAFNEIKKLAQPQDVFVFYYAGHGYIEPTSKEFYLVSSDVTDAGASLLQNGIPAKELQQYAVDIQAQKQLFVLDACQSAGAFDAMLKHDGEQQKSLAVVARSTGTHWMAASGSLETAKEFGELGHGAFTYVMLQALKGQAAANKMITVNGLKNFLQVKVPELVKKYGGNNQYPASYGQGNDFPVEIVK